VQASPPLTALGPGVQQTPGGKLTPGSKGSPVSTRALRALGGLGLLGVLTTVFLVTAGAASKPSQYVPARSGGWPGWLAGPLEGLHMSITPDRFQTLTLIMAASYLAVLLAARALPGRALWVTIIAAHPGWPWVDEMTAVVLHKGNVYWELSGWAPKYLPESLKKDIRGRLRDKVMFGSDYPSMAYERIAREWGELAYPVEVMEGLFHKNAERVLGFTR